jgi:CheY-like chemotaxis protein
MSKILIVDDEKQYRELLSDALKQEKFETVTAENGNDALVRVKEHPDVDLILLDLLMPKTDGVTFFYNLKKETNRDIPIIILTNLTDAAYPADKNIRDFIVKANTSLAQVVEKIRMILNG